MGLLRLMGNKADVVKGLAKRCESISSMRAGHRTSFCWSRPSNLGNENWLVAPKSDIVSCFYSCIRKKSGPNWHSLIDRASIYPISKIIWSRWLKIWITTKRFYRDHIRITWLKSRSRWRTLIIRSTMFSRELSDEWRGRARRLGFYFLCLAEFVCLQEIDSSGYCSYVSFHPPLIYGCFSSDSTTKERRSLDKRITQTDYDRPIPS